MSAVVSVVAVLAAAPVVTAATAVRVASEQRLVGPVQLDSEAANLRVTLDRLLAEHAFLTIEQMRSGLTGSADQAAAAKGVEGNSTDVANAIGSIYGDAAVVPFGEVWRSHIGYLVDYAVSLGKNDTAGKQQALDGLADYRAKVRAFLTQANPGVSLGGIVDALDLHTAQMIAFIDKEHSGDHAAAYAVERAAYPHMFDVGDALAKVIANKFAARFSGMDVAYSSAGTLRVTLDRLLGEHAFLSAEAMRAGVVGEAYFGAAKVALDENSTALADLVKAAYGRDASARFGVMWRQHIDAYLRYIDATRTNDGPGRAKAVDNISLYAAQLGDFLAAANPHLDAATTTKLFREHAQHLIDQVEAFGKGDYDLTYTTVRAGYAHMFMVGEALAAALATQFPAKFPASVSLPATDTLASGGVFVCSIGGPFWAVAAAHPRAR
jgi:hypothetical protein